MNIWLILAMLPVGAGMGMAIPPLIAQVLRAVATSDAGTAAGMLTTSQQIGNALGVAIVGTIFFGELGSRTSPAAFGEAFSVALAAQALLALASATLVARARRPSEAPQTAHGRARTSEGI